MHYTDDVRRFNFASGFVLGALVGAGLGLIGRPLRASRPPRRVSGGAALVGRSAREGIRHLRDGARDAGAKARREVRSSRFGIAR